MRSAKLREQAAEWVILLDDEDCPAQKKTDFNRWLSADPAHRKAFEQARRTWGDLDAVDFSHLRSGIPADGAHVAGKPAATHIPHAPPYRIWAGTACSILVITAVVFQNDLQVLWRADVRTAFGETRQLTLEDGTRVHLNTNSAIAFHVTPQRREARVLAGEAVFDIARDIRPFRVRAGNADITDIGTVFQVRIEHDDSVAVTVSEGEVKVEQDGASASVLQGQHLSYSSRSGLAKVEAADIDSATAWQRGRMIFVDQPLGRVITELNRYTAGHIRLANGALAELKVSGVYKTEDPFAALSTIEQSLGLRSVRVGKYALVMGRNADR